MSHTHAPPDSLGRAFLAGIVLNLAFVLVEVVAGLTVGSLALLSDAGHNLGDVFGLILASIAIWLGRRRSTARRTYGMKRSSIVVALLNAILLLVAVGAIAGEAIRRFGEPHVPSADTVIWVAAAGVIVNTVTAALFLRGRKSDLNVRGAFLHMAADAGVSLGVIVAGLLIRVTAWTWLDPVVSLAIAAVILVGTWHLLTESLDMSLDAVPRGLDSDRVRSRLEEWPGVVGVHELHIWPMSTTETALTAHLIVLDRYRNDALLSAVTAGLAREFDIHHATIQVESASSPLREDGAACRIPVVGTGGETKPQG